MNALGTPDVSIFDRIVCGVDGTPESLLAVKQAGRLQRPKSLGSVSERIAHQASCSVLVVRDAAPRLIGS